MSRFPFFVALGQSVFMMIDFTLWTSRTFGNFLVALGFCFIFFGLALFWWGRDKARENRVSETKHE